jgi:acetyl esterase/lipase
MSVSKSLTKSHRLAQARLRAALLCVVAFILMAPAIHAAPAKEPAARSEIEQFFDLQMFPIWPGKPPGAVGNSPQDIPTLTLFKPSNRTNGAAVIIAPGGAYVRLAANHEGRQVADWFTARGFTAFVLRYRLGPSYPLPTPLLDAQRAIRTVRARAREFDLDPARIGMMGFSAGGHLTATVGTMHDAGKADAADPIDRVSDRPDFLVLGYPALLMLRYGTQGRLAYCDLMKMKQGCDREYLDRYSPELHVDAHTPPTFLFHTTEDATVPASDSVVFYSALTKAGVPAEIHIFEHGGHGMGLGNGDAAFAQWPALLDVWLRGRGLFAPNPNPNPSASQ